MQLVDDVAKPGVGQKSPVMAGVGIIFAGLEGKQLLFVDAMVSGGPAEKSGQVFLGDTLVSVDETDVRGISDDELAKLIIGPIGTKVTLGFLRGNDPQIKYATIVRGFSKPQTGFGPQNGFAGGKPNGTNGSNA